MTTTPGPWTVEREDEGYPTEWTVLADGRRIVARCPREADARALVTLPALQYSVKRALELLEGDTFGNVQAAVVVLTDALAQADGPAPPKTIGGRGIDHTDLESDGPEEAR